MTIRWDGVVSKPTLTSSVSTIQRQENVFESIFDVIVDFEQVNVYLEFDFLSLVNQS